MYIKRILLYPEVFMVLLTVLCLKEITKFNKIVIFLVGFHVSSLQPMKNSQEEY